jgi:hypothetical protein
LANKVLFISILIFGFLVSVNCVAAADSPTTSISTHKGHNLNVKSINPTGLTSSGVAKSARNIKVLIYNGKNANIDSVNQIKSSLGTANTKQLAPGYSFTYRTSTVINAATLQGYDVLVIPGADMLYIQNDGKTIDSINQTALKNFVASGKGFYGICGGAYCGSKYVQGWVNCWGVAPHVYSTFVGYEGKLSLQMTTQGQQILRSGSSISIKHVNGPVLYPATGSIVLAKYADDIIGSKWRAAMVGDYYGKGRSVLCGPHPEFDPKHPNIVANSIVWASSLPKIPPKVLSTVPINLKTGVSRTSSVLIKFSANIKASINFNYISIKNLTTSKNMTVNKTISNNLLILKTSIKSALTWFRVTIPANAVKDLIGTNLASTYILKFKTGA